MKKYDVMESIEAMEQNVKDIKTDISGMLGEMIKDFDIINNTQYDEESAKCMLMYMKMLSNVNKAINNWINMEKGICERLDKIEDNQELLRDLIEKVDK